MDANDTDRVRVRINLKRDDAERVDTERVDTDRVSITMSCSDIEELKEISKKLHMMMPQLLRALIKCGTIYYKDNLEKRWIGWDEEAQEPIEREDWQENYKKFRRYGFIR